MLTSSQLYCLHFGFAEPLFTPKKQKYLLNPFRDKHAIPAAQKLPGGIFDVLFGGPFWAEFTEFRGKRDCMEAVEVAVSWFPTLKGVQASMFLLCLVSVYGC